MRRLICASAILIAGCGGQGSAVPDSGVLGVVTIGPTCPVEQVGATVSTVTSDSDGRFSAALAPGDYRVESAQSAQIPSLAPVPVTVRPDAYTRVSVRFDSGIR